MDRTAFYIDDHAHLCALFIKHLMQKSPETGLQVLERAVNIYARERGLRSAMRCLANNDPLTVASYMVYAELQDYKAWNKSVVVALAPFYQSNMVSCGWYDTWKKFGLLEYGKLYCNWIDVSLLQGFNPEIHLEMGEILAHGASVCAFNWRNFAFKDQDEVDKILARRKELFYEVTKDFLYHSGHMLNSFKRTLYLELGPAIGQIIVEGALTDYAKDFGNDKRALIEAESNQDFQRV